MAKKDFKKAGDILDQMFTQAEEDHEAAKTEEVITTEGKRGRPAPNVKKQEYYRFNLKTPIEYKEFLEIQAWKERMTVTQLINSLIANYKEEKEGGKK